MSFVDHTYQQYIDAYRVNFRNWKIVDIDNFMDGNHFFSELKEEQIWSKKVIDTTGDQNKSFALAEKSGRAIFSKDEATRKAGYEELMAEIDLIDTKSNRKMTPLHKQKAIILEKRAI